MYAEKKRLALSGRLPDYIYCNVPITPVKSPVGSGERRSRDID